MLPEKGYNTLSRSSGRTRTTLEKLRLPGKARRLDLADFEHMQQLVAAGDVEVDIHEGMITQNAADQVGCGCGNMALKTLACWYAGKPWSFAACYACGYVYEY